MENIINYYGLSILEKLHTEFYLLYLSSKCSLLLAPWTLNNKIKMIDLKTKVIPHFYL